MFVELEYVAFLVGRERRQVPEAHARVFAPCRQHLAVWRESQRQDRGGVSGQGQELFAAGNVPLAGSAIAAAGRQALAVGGKSQTKHAAVVATQGFLFLTRAGVPQAHGPVFASRRQHAPVRREGDGGHTAGMGGNGEAQTSQGGVPELDGGVVAASRGECLAVGSKGHGRDAAGVTAGEHAILAAQMMVHAPGKITQVVRATLLVEQKTQGACRIGFPGLFDLGELDGEQEAARKAVLLLDQLRLPIRLGLLPLCLCGRGLSVGALLAGFVRRGLGLVALVLRIAGCGPGLVAFILGLRGDCP